MAWVFLLLAGACEMVWPLGFKYTHGFKSNYGIIALTLGIMTLSFWLMSLATSRGIHLGTAYAVWTGMGAAGTAVVGMILFKEPHDVVRLMCLMLIIVGAIGLKFLSPPSQASAPPSTTAQVET